MTSPSLGSISGGDDADVRMVDEVSASVGPFQELGVTGLKRSSGYLDEEFLPALKGRKAVQIYREMGDNDPIVGAMLFAMEQLLRNANWEVVPGGKSADHAKAAKLLETCKDDMSHTWDEFVVECLSHLRYGWAWHEIVYKRRMSPWDTDGRRRSRHTDGLVGWRKMPIRSQETLHRWVFDETGGIAGMIQLAPPDYKMRTLPIDRSLLFRFGAHKNSPEGRSMLRNAYRPWFYKKRVEEFEAIGVERDLAGLPVVKVPAEWLRAGKNTEQGKQVEAFKKMVRGIRRNEQEGVVFPTAFDPETRQPLFDLSLLGSGGARAFQTSEIIQRYEQRILMTVLADFIMVGHSKTGTYNLHVDKTGIFRNALNSTLQSMCDVMNRHAVPRLFLANGWKPAELPQFSVTNVDAPDLAQLGSFLAQTAGLGFNWGPDANLEKYLRDAAGLPEISEQDLKRRKKSAETVTGTRFATEQSEYMAAKSALQQQMQQQMMAEQGIPTPEEQQAEQEQGQAAQQQELAVRGDQREQEKHEKEMATPIPSPAAKPAPAKAK